MQSIQWWWQQQKQWQWWHDNNEATMMIQWYNNVTTTMQWWQWWWWWQQQQKQQQQWHNNNEVTTMRTWQYNDGDNDNAMPPKWLQQQWWCDSGNRTLAMAMPSPHCHHCTCVAMPNVDGNPFLKINRRHSNKGCSYNAFIFNSIYLEVHVIKLRLTVILLLF